MDTAPAAETLLTADQVLDYLRGNPDFLAEQLDLFLGEAGLAENGNVVDLRSFALGRFQGQPARPRTEFLTQERLFQAVLALLDAPDFVHLMQVVTGELVDLVGVDAVTLCLEVDGLGRPRLAANGVQLLPRGSVQDLLGPGRPRVISHDEAADPAIFGPAAPLIRAQALYRLDVRGRLPIGLIAFGGRGRQLFASEQTRDNLGFLARVLERAIARWLKD